MTPKNCLLTSVYHDMKYVDYFALLHFKYFKLHLLIAHGKHLFYNVTSILTVYYLLHVHKLIQILYSILCSCYFDH